MIFLKALIPSKEKGFCEIVIGRPYLYKIITYRETIEIDIASKEKIFVS